MLAFSRRLSVPLALSLWAASLGTGCSDHSGPGGDTACTGGCLIESICHASEDPNPDNPCQLCRISDSTTEWTNADGIACDDGSFCNGTETCTAGACNATGDPCAGNPACNDTCDEDTDSCEIDATACLIAGTCYANGHEDPANTCRECNIRVSQTAWTNDDRNACDDGLHCTGVESCSAGACNATGDPCAGNPACNDTCDEDTDSCDLDPTACLISGTCYANGEEDPANTCRECDISASQTAWTDDDTNACDDGLFCNGAETCAGGACGNSVGDPCVALRDDTDADCATSCDEAARACTGADPDGTACVPGVPTLCATYACALGVCSVDIPCPVFVHSSTGVDSVGCGDSWGTACATLQAGVDRAAQAGNLRVFASGDFLPPSSAFGTVLTMAADVAVFGGFVGTESAAAERVVSARSTIDGDFNQDDPAPLDDYSGQADNAGPLVVGAEGATLDGFTITAGRAAAGAGMATSAVASLSVRNTDFVRNTADSAGARGGAMANDAIADLVLSNVSFVENRARGAGGGSTAASGGALSNTGGTNATLTDVVFSGNQLVAGGSGAGMFEENGTSTLDNVQFDGNVAINGKGGGYAGQDTATSLQNMSFIDNSVSTALGGGMYVKGMAVTPVTLANVTFTRNTVGGSGRGGGLYVEGNTTTLSDVRFDDNVASGGYSDAGGGASIHAANATLTNVTFAGNSVGYYGRGGGLHVMQGSLTLTDVTFVNNRASYTAYGAGLSANQTALDFKRVVFTGNTTKSGYGGGACITTCTGTLNDATFLGNKPSGMFVGGGSLDLANVSFLNNIGTGLRVEWADMSVRDARFIGNLGPSLRATAAAFLDSNINILNALVSGNDTRGDTDPAGIYLGGTTAVTATLTNVTFADNISASTWASVLIMNSGGTLSLTNVAVHGNTVPAFDGSIGFATIMNACLQGTGYTGTGIVELASDPFVRGAAGEVFLDPTSACVDIDAGNVTDPVFVDGSWQTYTTAVDETLDSGVVDAGYHYQPSRDIRVLAFDFLADGTTAAWSILGPVGLACHLSGDGGSGAFEFDIAPATFASGSADATAANGEITLSCGVGGQYVTARRVAP